MRCKVMWFQLLILNQILLILKNPAASKPKRMGSLLVPWILSDMPCLPEAIFSLLKLQWPLIFLLLLKLGLICWVVISLIFFWIKKKKTCFPQWDCNYLQGRDCLFAMSITDSMHPGQCVVVERLRKYIHWMVTVWTEKYIQGWKI